MRGLALGTVAAVAIARAALADGSAPDGPPDPARGEPLDGRAEAPDGAGRRVARAALAVPRVAADVVFWPLVKTTEVLEVNHVPNHVASWLTTDDGLIGVRPVVQYATGFRPTGGARVFDRRLLGPGSDAEAHALTGGPRILDTGLDLHTGPALGIQARLAWIRRNDRLFAGIGPRTRDELADGLVRDARYQSDAYLAEVGVLRPIAGPLALLGRVDVQRQNYGSDDVRGGPPLDQVYDVAAVPGLARGLRMLHAGLRLTLDLREHARDGSGVWAAVEGTLGTGVAGDPARDARARAELVGALGGHDRLLLLRLTGAFVDPLGAEPVPFEELIVPAGRDGLRGHPFGRFRGRSAVVATLEYRWFIGYAMDATLFADYGGVLDERFAGFRFERLFPDVGVGLRFYAASVAEYWRAALSNGVQVAWAPDSGFRLLLFVAAF